MTRTFFPLWPARDQGLPLRVGLRRTARPGEGIQAERAERRQVDPVDGGLVGAGDRWPARAAGLVQVLSAFQRATIGSRRRKTGRSRSADRAIGTSLR